jgi:hypothetical protein
MKKVSNWIKTSLIALVVATIVAVLIRWVMSGTSGFCPSSMYYCPGVGCVSGQDKCFPGATGGASAVFSKETFTQWPGAGVRAKPPVYDVVKENFVSKKCPDGTRSDGPCLMEFPGF